MRGQRHRRGRQRGQGVPIIAPPRHRLLGSPALAPAPSLQTHYRRNLQNVADAAALAGVRDLGALANQPDRASAVGDALSTVAGSLKLAPFGTSWNGSGSCSGSQCDVTLTS